MRGEGADCGKSLYFKGLGGNLGGEVFFKKFKNPVVTTIVTENDICHNKDTIEAK